MADIPLSKISKIQSIQDSDSIVVIASGKEHLITKENFSKVLSILTTEQKNKLSTILLSGDSSKVLTDSGVYKSINNMFTQGQVNLNNNTKLFEINGYHTHTNTEVLDKFSVEGDTLLFDGEEISTYTLPPATNNILGGVKVDGDTIKINDGIISADVIGNWISGVSYPVGYFVVYNDKFYQCIEANSDEEWIETKWNPILCEGSDSANITEWENNKDYDVNDLVIYENTIYKCVENHTSETEFDSEKWTSIVGVKGDSGVSPILSYETTNTGVIVTMTDANNTHTFNLFNGVDGNNGKSAYEIAVDNGFEGTEEEFLQSLKGQDGITTITTNKIDKICTFTSDNWSNIAPYTQTVEVEGITEDLNPRIDVIISDDITIGKTEENDFSYFTRAITGNGTITAYCYETKPTVDLNIMIEVI